jgi:succinate dehydrogenase/fumarate reductase flavoprotein subunit
VPSISDKTEVGLPLKNLIGLLGIAVTTAWGYFGIIERLNNLELRATLFEADLLKSADQKPIDNEQYMLLEFTSSQVEKILKQLDDMQNNKVNISRLQKDMEKSINDIEKLKDKVRANGNH